LLVGASILRPGPLCRWVIDLQKSEPGDPSINLVAIDDSISMRIEQNGERIEALRVALRTIARIYSLARPEGICELRFLNYQNMIKNITVKKVNGIIQKHVFRGQTRLGTELRRKVLQQWVKDDMKRPVVVITITDGDVRIES
jgi:hypothetical protein